MISPMDWPFWVAASHRSKRSSRVSYLRRPPSISIFRDSLFETTPVLARKASTRSAKSGGNVTNSHKIVTFTPKTARQNQRLPIRPAEWRGAAAADQHRTKANKIKGLCQDKK